MIGKLKKLTIFICIMVFVFVVIRKTRPYELHYFKLSGLNKVVQGATENDYFNYEDVILNFGEPKNIVVDEVFNAVDLYYNGIVFRCGSNGLKSRVLHVTTTLPEHRFGLYKIGVGSSKKLVTFAYKDSSAVPSPDVDGAYIDTFKYIEFRYDDEDNVKEISIGLCD